MEEKKRLLWVDDEIDLLKSHIIFLESRGYDVAPASNGDDAISMIGKERFDIVLLDEMMAGRDGLSTLEGIKEIDPGVPVIMVTKSEEERLMDEAIGRRIDDYLTKPVNPSQILSACKRILDARKIQGQQVTKDYVSEFNKLKLQFADGHMDWRQWSDIHRDLARWDLLLDRFPDVGLRQTHEEQKKECNHAFGKYVESNYSHWLQEENPPVLSVDVVAEYLYPLLLAKKQVFFVVIDCMRLDQWLALEDILNQYYDITRHLYYSILPTATPYSRNALFSGLYPGEIAQKYPDLWKPGTADDQSKNRHERQLLDHQLQKMGLHFSPDPKYVKILEAEEAANVSRKLSSYFDVPLTSLVFNFLDILAHGRSESEILQEIAPDETAFRSLMRTWFQHSHLFDILKTLAKRDVVVVVTTDHGSVLCTRGTKAFGKKDTSTNLRYKYGNNLRCDTRQSLLINKPQDYKLPTYALNTTYIIAKEDYYFVYPTKFHEYQRQYKNSFQHGGISMEEMILPLAVMRPK
jgi:DNA-binding response OmpR family regulator